MNILTGCQKFKDNKTYFVSYKDSEDINLASIIVGDPSWGDDRCFIESELMNILMNKNYGRFNITYRDFHLQNDLKKLMETENIDVYLGLTSIEEWMYKFANAHWIREDYNLVMLSALYGDSPKISNTLRVFPTIIWIFILNSLLLISFIILIKKEIKKMSEINTFATYGEIVFRLSRYLISQSTSPGKCRSIIENVIWSTMSLILVFIYSGNMYSKLISRDLTCINSYEEMIESNLTLLSGNSSFLYYSVQYVHENNNRKFIELKPRVQFEVDWDADYHKRMIERLSKREAVYIRDGFTVLMRFLENPHFSLAIGENKYFSTLLGFPINKRPTNARKKLLNIMKKLVEFGIYDRQHSRIITVKKIDGINNAREYWKANNIIETTDYDIRVDIVFLFDAVVKAMMSCGFSLLVVLFEILLNHFIRT